MSFTDVEVPIRAAEAGAAVVRSRFRTDLVRHVKTPGDFATDADLEAEQSILTVIRAARPVTGSSVGWAVQAGRSRGPVRGWRR